MGVTGLEAASVQLLSVGRNSESPTGLACGVATFEELDGWESQGWKPPVFNSCRWLESRVFPVEARPGPHPNGGQRQLLYMREFPVGCRGALRRGYFVSVVGVLDLSRSAFQSINTHVPHLAVSLFLIFSTGLRVRRVIFMSNKFNSRHWQTTLGRRRFRQRPRPGRRGRNKPVAMHAARLGDGKGDGPERG